MMTKQSFLALLLVILASVFTTEACEMYFQQYVDPTCTEAEDELPAIVGIGSTLPNTCSGSIDGPKGSAYIWKCTDDGLGVSITWCAPDSVVASSSTCLMCEPESDVFYRNGCDYSDFLGTYVKAIYLEGQGGCCAPV